MFVLTTARPCGHDRAILASLDNRARGLDGPLLLPDTGDAQPEAIRLEESVGYRPVRYPGASVDSPHSRCVEKRLQPVDRVR
jgi:hypothetical protein